MIRWGGMKKALAVFGLQPGIVCLIPANYNRPTGVAGMLGADAEQGFYVSHLRAASLTERMRDNC
jgi:hypothetical protein